MADMADILQLRSSSSPCVFSSQASASYPYSSRFSQCCPPPSSFISRSLDRATWCRSRSVIATVGFRVENLRRLCASQHVGGGSVERNDASATGPSVKPEAKLTAEEAVVAQMSALAHNDRPRPDHGLEVLYHFADSEGALNGGSLSEYFGFPSDLYHFGHFALKFKSRYPELLCHNGYEIVNTEGDDEDHCEIKLKLKQAKNDADSEWVFSLSRRSRGVLPPCWLTSSLLKVRDCLKEMSALNCISELVGVKVGRIMCSYRFHSLKEPQ